MAHQSMGEHGHFRAGRWFGHIAAETAPTPQVKLNGEPIEGATVSPAGDGRWEISFPVPQAALADGVQSFVISDLISGARLATATILTGLPVEDDLRAEIALLRAELELVKRSLRRLAAGG